MRLARYTWDDVPPKLVSTPVAPVLLNEPTQSRDVLMSRDTYVRDFQSPAAEEIARLEEASALDRWLSIDFGADEFDFLPPYFLTVLAQSGAVRVLTQLSPYGSWHAPAIWHPVGADGLDTSQRWDDADGDITHWRPLPALTPVDGLSDGRKGRWKPCPAAVQPAPLLQHTQGWSVVSMPIQRGERAFFHLSLPSSQRQRLLPTGAPQLPAFSKQDAYPHGHNALNDTEVQRHEGWCSHADIDGNGLSFYCKSCGDIYRHGQWEGRPTLANPTSCPHNVEDCTGNDVNTWCTRCGSIQHPRRGWETREQARHWAIPYER